MTTVWSKTGLRSGQASQLTTEAAPTSGNVGVDMDGVGSISVVIHAPAGQTFDGSGALSGYKFFANAWIRAPRADIDMADYVGLADAALPSIAVDAPIGRFIYVPSSVGLSGAGTTIVTDYVCTTRFGAQGPG